MSLKTFVKVSNVSNLSDARYCAGMGVDVIGFNLDTSTPKHLSPEEYNQITKWISGVQFAGEFESVETGHIRAILNNFSVDYIQISKIFMIDELADLDKKFILKITVSNDTDLSEFSSLLSTDRMIDIILVKSFDGKFHARLDEIIQFHSGDIHILKGYGMEDISLLDQFPGVEFEGGEEKRSGYEDYGEVMDILEALKTED